MRTIMRLERLSRTGAWIPSSTATGRRERTAPNWVPRTSTSPPGSGPSGIGFRILGEFGIGNSLENRIGSIPACFRLGVFEDSPLLALVPALPNQVLQRLHQQ